MKSLRPVFGGIVILLTVILLIYSCKKEVELPEVTTTQVSQVYLDSLLGGGNVISEGASPVIERGVCWSLGQNPTIEDKRTSDGSGTGEYSSYITGFQTNSTYFFRAYATNAEGTAYGEQVSFHVNPMYPEFKTEVTQLTGSGATVSVNLTCDNALNIYASGIVYGTKPELEYNKDIVQLYTGEGKSFSLELAHLNPASLYYYKPFVIFRLYGTTNIYLIYGETLFFKTGGLPSVKTISVISVSDTMAEISGEVFSSVVISRGICITIGHTPTINDIVVKSSGNSGSYRCVFTNLIPDKTYSARAFATGEEGTAYGEELTFKTDYGVLTDASGNTYLTKRIGTQIWMQENLRTTKLNDNTEIALLTNDVDWKNASAPAYSTFQAETPAGYGLLYNWFAVNTSKLCPSGWHVPSAQEFNILLGYLGYPYSGLKDEEVFNAVFPGYKDYNGIFHNIGISEYWWGSNTANSLPFAMYGTNSGFVGSSYYSKNFGFSVRCLKD